MNNGLSERVEREFKEWKERYEISYDMEFDIKALLKLQEEYDNTEVGSNTTLTRRTILDMINKLHRDTRLKPKEIVKEEVPMYIDFSRVQVDLNEKINGIENKNMGICFGKVIIYIDNVMFTLNKNNLMRSYVSEIKSIINTYEEMNNVKVIAYIDTCGFGKSLFDELSEYDDIEVKELNIKVLK